MNDPVTGEQVREAMAAADITTVNHHDCPLCGYMTKFCLTIRGNLVFDPGCYCRGLQPFEPSSFDDAAGWINMQSSEAVRFRLKAAFGFPAPIAPAEPHP